ncbi:MAG: DNA primase [Gammaproteobacteria bacterium]|nr:MAG: DNA primase [Gammaproteobacteria bacterium]
MSGMIPQSFIDDLLDRIDIVDTVDSRVKLKKTGKNYSACCPFHDEKTPSFTVSPDKQFYYCFGCGASGNALGFVMDYERLSFPETIESLARVAGLTVPREVQTEAQIKREQERKSIYSLLEKADEFYQQQLRHHPSKHMAVNYLKGRGLDGKTAKDYGVGFAPPGWDNLIKALATNDEDKHLLIEGGMLIHHDQDKKLYDRFRHRIMFPIRDIRGRAIGFGGRVLGDDKPKYLNSPETPIFHKGQELYGLYEARLAYRDLPRLLVVEGYMDVVSLAQFGIRYGVATLGTACGEDHLNKAFKYTNEVVFCFDGDKAGRAAAGRALDASLTTMADGRTVKFLFLPEGEDPDTLVRKIGPEKFETMISMAVPLEDQLFDTAAEGLNIRTMEGRATFSKRAAPMLDKLPKSVFKELMFENLATRTGLNRNILQDLIVEATKNPQPKQEPVKEIAHTPTKPAPKQIHIQQAIHPQDTQNQIPRQHSEDPGWSDYYDTDAPPPNYEEYYSGHNSRSVVEKASPWKNANSRMLMTPAQKAVALLVATPTLAVIEPNHDLWLEDTDTNLLMLGRLLKVLHERPHYNISNLLGYWRGMYGEDETERLAKIAGNDLLQATSALSTTRDDTEAKADYDNQAAFKGCLDALYRHQNAKKAAAHLEKIKNSNFTQLSKEEREHLVRAALANKTPQQ